MPHDRLPGMTILTEPIGSIPRPAPLLQAMAAFQAGKLSAAVLEDAYASALQDTIQRFQQTGSPVITDGEQTKPSFATYPLAGLTNLASDGVTIPFADGHVREFKNTNRVLRACSFCNGMKTGYTEAAGRCLIASGQNDGRDIIVVVSLNETTQYNYSLGFPRTGPWLESFNSDVYDNWVNPLVAGNGGGVDANGPPMKWPPCPGPRAG